MPRMVGELFERKAMIDTTNPLIVCEGYEQTHDLELMKSSSASVALQKGSPEVKAVKAFNAIAALVLGRGK